jgi:hypothetical protein
MKFFRLLTTDEKLAMLPFRCTIYTIYLSKDNEILVVVRSYYFTNGSSSVFL